MCALSAVSSHFFYLLLCRLTVQHIPEKQAIVHQFYKCSLSVQDTDAFCRSTLCDPAVSSLISTACIPYAFDRRSRRLGNLTRQLRPSSFPYCAFLHPTTARPHAPFTLAGVQEGPCGPAELLAKAQAALGEVARASEAAQREQQSLALQRSVREQQDAELAASMEADRARAAEREAQTAREREAKILEDAKTESERCASLPLPILCLCRCSVSLVVRNHFENHFAVGQVPARTV
jgi:hypothetical protein